MAVSFLYSAAPLLIFPYISRVLGPEAIGKINFVDYTAQFFILLASFGIPFYGVREVARVRDQPALLSKVSLELVLLHLLISAASAILFLLLIFLRPHEFGDKALVVLAIVNLLANAFGLEWFIHGREDFRFLARRSFLVKLLTLAAVFLVVKTANDYLLYYGILVAGNLLILLLDGAYFLRHRPAFTRALGLRRHVKPLLYFFLTTVTLSIYTFFDTVILGIVAGTVAVGFYTTSLKIIRLSHSFINDLGGVLLPRVAYLVETGQRGEAARKLNQSLRYVLTVTIPLSAFILFSAREIILLLGGPQFLPSVPVLQLLAILPLLMGLGNLFFIQILLPYGREKRIAFGVLLGSVVSLGANFILCRLFAERGAALSCLLAECTITGYLGWYALREVKLSVSRSLIGQLLLTAACFWPIVAGARQLTDSFVLSFGLSVFFCGLLFCLLQLFLFRNPVVLEIRDFLLQKRRPRLSNQNA